MFSFFFQFNGSTPFDDSLQFYYPIQCDDSLLFDESNQFGANCGALS